ncbi:monovalent cation:proton antiporter family protein [Algicola sagamiensis]|uniref:monovalent cation:proton antiporter family protein n=1 Tax=Algicola sagamiensis TaxID=163869 RepID=UPI00035C4BF4|nr:monovalent cation:proton antiporter family protein [Algicola sagamiensis]
MENTSIFTEVVSLLAVAVAIVWMFKRIHMPAVLAYLAAGIIAGPSGIAIVTNVEEMHYVGEIGIVFLLFSLGLEFSLPKLIAMRHWVLGIGSLQVVMTMLIFFGLAWVFDNTLESAFVIGATLALSSTAVVIKQLAEQGLTHGRRGQLAISVLLFQDLAVVPILIVTPMLSGTHEQTLWMMLGIALIKGACVFFMLIAAGKWILPKVFNEVAQTRTDELFVLTALLVCLIAAGLTHLFGLSMALGSFLAGMMLSESNYRHQLEADIRPFRDILMGIFFVSVGMQMKLDILISQWYWLVIGLVVVIILKILILYFLIAWAKQPKKDALASAIFLSQVGEFGFVVVTLANNEGLLTAEMSSILIGIGVLSMALTPFMIQYHQTVLEWFSFVEAHGVQNDQQKASLYSNHVIICGFGRVGQTVSRFLKLEGVPFVALDLDPLRVEEAKQAGEDVIFGHARQKEILHLSCVERARLVIITFKDPHKSESIISAVKELAPTVRIVVRTSTDQHMDTLQEAGAEQVIPEALEGALMLVSHVLYMSGVPVSRILRRMQTERKNHYGFMHGFYPGENTEISLEDRDRLEHLHAVTLTSDAFGVGKTIRSLNLEARRVEISGLRRNGAEVPSPSYEMVLEERDTLILKGKPRRVERVERYLLEGSE